MRRRFRRRPLVPALIVGGMAALVLLRWYQESRLQPPIEVLGEGVVEIAQVIDGDTLRLTNGARVRLIGVDTPEVHFHDEPARKPEPWARDATRFTEEFLAQGTVRLEFDLERKDRFDRFLAYVWVDDVMLNEALLSAGLARARLEFHYSDSKKRVFRKAEEEARQTQLGIWSQP